MSRFRMDNQQLTQIKEILYLVCINMSVKILQTHYLSWPVQRQLSYLERKEFLKKGKGKKGAYVIMVVALQVSKRASLQTQKKIIIMIKQHENNVLTIECSCAVGFRCIQTGCHQWFRNELTSNSQAFIVRSVLGGQAGLEHWKHTRLLK